MTAFNLDAISITRLKGVHADLVRVVTDCAHQNDLPFIFGINEGLRTIGEQQRNVNAGVSMTMDSRHLTGHAIDLVVLLMPEKKIVWSWPAYGQLAGAMKEAAARCSVPLIWGGCWDKETASFTQDPMEENHAYVVRAKARGQKGFVDGPHFELPRERYP